MDTFSMIPFTVMWMDIYWGTDCIHSIPELPHQTLWITIPTNLSGWFAIPERYPMIQSGQGQHERITYSVGRKDTCIRYQTSKALVQLRETNSHSLTDLLNVLHPKSTPCRDHCE